MISSQHQITDESTSSTVGISTADIRDDGVTGVQKKRGRLKLSLQEHAKRIKRLRMHVSYRNAKFAKRFEIEEENGESLVLTIGDKVVNLIKEANCYTEKINGETCVSIVSGLLYWI